MEYLQRGLVRLRPELLLIRTPRTPGIARRRGLTCAARCDLGRRFGVCGIDEWIGLGIDLAAQVSEDFIGHLQKYFHDLGIELATDPIPDFLTSFAERSRRSIGAVRDDRVKRIRDREDPCA